MLDPDRPLRPNKTSIVWLGRTNRHCGQSSVTIAIDGVRWEYSMTAQNAETVEFYARTFSMGKALNFAKKRATASRRQEATHV